MDQGQPHGKSQEAEDSIPRNDGACPGAEVSRHPREEAERERVPGPERQKGLGFQKEEGSWKLPCEQQWDPLVLRRKRRRETLPRL